MHSCHIFHTSGVTDPFAWAGTIIDDACGNPTKGNYAKEYEDVLQSGLPLKWDRWTSIRQKIMRLAQISREKINRSDPVFPINMDWLDIRALRTILADRFPEELGFGKVYNKKQCDGYDLSLHKYPVCRDPITRKPYIDAVFNSIVDSRSNLLTSNNRKRRVLTNLPKVTEMRTPTQVSYDLVQWKVLVPFGLS